MAAVSHLLTRGAPRCEASAHLGSQPLKRKPGLRGDGGSNGAAVCSASMAFPRANLCQLNIGSSSALESAIAISATSSSSYVTDYLIIRSSSRWRSWSRSSLCCICQATCRRRLSTTRDVVSAVDLGFPLRLHTCHVASEESSSSDCLSSHSHFNGGSSSSNSNSKGGRRVHQMGRSSDGGLHFSAPSSNFFMAAGSVAATRVACTRCAASWLSSNSYVLASPFVASPHDRRLLFGLLSARATGRPSDPSAMSSSSSSSPTPPLPSSSSSSSSSTSASASASSSSSPSSTQSKVDERRRGSTMSNSPRSLWSQIVKPLNNFGFGKRSIWEGGVGLFIMAGFFMFGLSLSWIASVQIRARSRKYTAVFEFAQACGITVGTPVRIRGVTVGTVMSVKPSLDKIDAEVEISDQSVVIPRNSLLEVNQSGLISETLIDITPRPPIPNLSFGPLDAACASEGLIVCHRERMKGEQGVSLDELVGICTKIARQVDQHGVARMFETAERVSLAVEDAKPLLGMVESLAKDIAPLLKDLKEGELLHSLEELTFVAAAAAKDLQKLNSAVLTDDNIKLLKESVATLTKTLKHIESISGDVSSLTGDPGTRYNIKQIVQSLSRLVSD